MDQPQPGMQPPRASSKLGWVIGGIVLLGAVAAIIFLTKGSSPSNANFSNQALNAATAANVNANVNTSTSTQNLNASSNANVTPSANTSTNVNTGSTNANTNTNVSSSNTNTAKAAQVSITENGFSPAVLTVASGTIVTFVNDDSAPHQPASDPHPTHTSLPGFDALRGLQTGASYSFTFTKTGTFGYHDHLNTFLTGTIVVQ